MDFFSLNWVTYCSYSWFTVGTETPLPESSNLTFKSDCVHMISPSSHEQTVSPCMNSLCMHLGELNSQGLAWVSLSRTAFTHGN